RINRSMMPSDGDLDHDISPNSLGIAFCGILVRLGDELEHIHERSDNTRPVANPATPSDARQDTKNSDVGSEVQPVAITSNSLKVRLDNVQDGSKQLGKGFRGGMVDDTG